MKSFAGKVAVISGAGSGLGRSFARQLFAAGARLALCDINPATLEETGRLIAAPAGQVSLHPVDVASGEQMRAFAAEVQTQHGPADLLINNAGIGMISLPFEQITEAQFEKILAINLGGVYHGVRAFLPQLKSRPEAAIVNISSLAGLVGIYGFTAYSTSKFAVRGLSEALQSELSGSQVSVLVVYPGGIKTNLVWNAPNLNADQRAAAHAIFSKFALLEPDAAARQILRAVQKKQRRLVLGVDARLLNGLCGLLPGLAPNIIRAIFSKLLF